MTLDEAIKHCEEVAKKYESRLDSPYKTEEHELDDKFCKECAADHRQLAEWLTELQELRLQIEAPRLGSIEEYHYELARCKTAFWSCNKRCMEAVEQYRRKVEELKTVQEQISEYKRILKAAVEDLRWVNENTQDAYGTCIMKKSEGCGDCPLDINGDLWCKWKHEAEALALIGEDGDPE